MTKEQAAQIRSLQEQLIAAGAPLDHGGISPELAKLEMTDRARAIARQFFSEEADKVTLRDFDIKFIDDPDSDVLHATVTARTPMAASMLRAAAEFEKEWLKEHSDET